MTKNPAKLLIPLLILILAGLAFWFVLSRPAGTPTISPGEEVQATEFVTESGTYYDIDAKYPGKTILLGSANAAAIGIMRTFIETEIISFKENSRLNSLTPEDIEMWGLGEERKFAYASEYHVYTSPRTVSYVFDVFVDTLGAHPNGYHRSFTFDRETGFELSIADLFADDAAYLGALSDIARRDLPGIIAAKGGTSVEEADTAYIETGTEPAVENFQTFYLEGSTLVIVFSPYQVGPWVIGTQELSIPRTELSHILKAEYR